MSLIIPRDSKYYAAMRHVRNRRYARAFWTILPYILMSATLVWLLSIRSVRYWTFEIGVSLFIDAIVYVLMPLFFVGVAYAILNNWRVILVEIFRCFKEAAQFMRILGR